MIQPGDVVGDYRVLERAGAGGMGVVFRVEHLITRRIEAMKVLPLGIGCGPDEIRRFEREIQAQARLQHPHIVPLYSAVRRDDAFALLMEWIDGETLERRLEREQLPIDMVLGLAAQVLQALAYAHRRGVLHCDVSPGNIFLTGDGAAKLSDFGLARAASDLGLAVDGVAMGSPWNMSPEQVRGAGPIDARADLYAAGTVLYEMLAGRKLFDAEGTFAILRAHLDTTPEPPGRYRSGIPPSLDAVVMRALAKDPASRFQSADEFRLAIQGAMIGRAPARRRTTLRPMLVAAWVGMIACSAVLLPMRPGIAVVEAPSLPPPAPPPVPPPPPEPEAPPAPAPEVEGVPVNRRPTRRPEPPRAVLGPIRPIERAVAFAPAPPPAEPESHDPMPVSAPPLVPAPAAPAVEKAAPAPVPEAKPAKPGNRFVRAIGKLNPFRKRQ